MNLSNFISDLNLSLRAELLAYRTLFAPNLTRWEASLIGNSGIVGAGIHAVRKCPFVFVTTKHLPANEITRVREIPAVHDVFRLLGLEGEMWNDVVAWGTLEPEPQVLTGDVVTGSQRGTAGPPVQWGGVTNPNYGILVSGHVVGKAASVNDPKGKSIGTIKEVHEAATGGVDVALVELASKSGTARFSGPVFGTAMTSIDLLKPSGKATDPIIAKAGWLYWSIYSATYLDLYVTNSVISSGGDSGSAAVVAGTADLVGTLVGASVGSLIQDGHTQLSAFTSVSSLTL